MAKTPQQIAEKWQRRMAGATQDYTEGIDSVTVAPGEMAAQRMNAYVDGVQRAASSGRTERAMRSVSLAEWKAKAKEKGAQRLASGATAAVGKVRDTMQTLMSNIEDVRGELASMPRDTPEQRMQYSMAWQRAMHERPIK